MKEIDENIKELVELLNTFDGISTMSCCGGHKNPELGQILEGEWYVNFDICNSKGYPTKYGWESIGKILQSIDNCILKFPNMKIILTLWNPSDSKINPNGLSSLFELYGKSNFTELKAFCNELRKRKNMI